MTTVDQIQEATARYFGLEVRDLLCKRQNARLVLARHIAMYLAWKDTRMSYAEIGRAFGDRDHRTVMHAIERIEERIPRPPRPVNLGNSRRARDTQAPEQQEPGLGRAGR